MEYCEKESDSVKEDKGCKNKNAKVITPVKGRELLKEKQLGKETIKFAVDPAKYKCPHSATGCQLVFLSEHCANLHSNTCIYGILRWCKEKTCVDVQEGREKNLVGLVEHAIQMHSCLKMVGGGNDDDEKITLPITLSRDFLNQEFNAKLLGTYEKDKDGSPVKIVFVGLARKEEDKVLHMIPITFGDPTRMNYFMRVRMKMLNQDSKPTKCKTKLRHSSHLINGGFEVLVRVIRSAADLCDVIQNKETAAYSLKDLGWEEQKGDAEQCPPLQIGLTFGVDTYRCHVADQDDVRLKADFCLTWDQLNVTSKIRNKLFKEGQADVDDLLPPPATGILLPALRKKENLTIIHNDVVFVMKHILTRVYEDKEPTSRNPLLLLLFPAESMMHSIAPLLIPKAESIGLRVVTLQNTNENYSHRVKFGCDAIFTTPTVLLDMLMRSFFVFLTYVHPELKYIVVPNADCILDDDVADDINNCLKYAMRASKYGIVRIATTNFVGAELMECLKGKYFSSEFKIIALGPQPYTQIKAMGVIRRDTYSLWSKIDSVLAIVRGLHDDQRLLIVGNERKGTYKTEFGELMETLAKEFPQRHLLRCDEENAIEAGCFNDFKTRPGCILLSSYYALQYESVKICDSIIIYDTPKRKSIRMRFVNVAKKNDGTMKEVHLLVDGKKV